MTSSRRTIDDRLDEARERLHRVEAQEAAAAFEQGAVLVDIRSDHQRERDGTIPGAIYHPRNVLEWRLDPASDARDTRLSDDLDCHVILFCDAGYASSLAAVSAQELGFENATDLIGGFKAWRDAGLPVERDGA